MALPMIRRQRTNQRRLRTPTVNFHLRTRPWQIQPFCIFPVIPGETLQNALWKSRVVSDPVKSRLIGWHKEYFLFYVRFRGLVDTEDFRNMFTDPEANLSSHHSAADPKYFHKYGVNFTKLATERIVEHYFRADDENIGVATIDGMYAASTMNDNWLDSALPADAYQEMDQPVDINDDNEVMASEVDKAMRLWNHLRANGLTDATYEDFLASYGVSVPAAELEQRPWLLRHIREWVMPSNTIDPTTGAATTAVTWSIDERADRNRFIKEPGFVVGLTLARPKVYLSNQAGPLTGIMDTAAEWLPAIFRDDPYSSLIQVAAAQGPLTGQTKGYVFDLRDLFLYGEQFTNFTPEAAMNAIALPGDNMAKRYPSLAMARSIFVDDSAAPGARKQFLEEDGRIDLTFSTQVEDSTPPPRQLAV